MKVLAVGAHPDDLEILCGGTLARFVQEGHEVVMCNAAKGNRGSFIHTSEEIARLRGEEASRAAQICGAEHVTLGIGDAEVSAADREQQRAMVDLVRDARPDFIITHFPHDYMSDHNETSKLVFESSFHATLPLYETSTPHYSTVTPIAYMDTIMGVGFQPVEYVDVTSAIETKVAMLEAHESQLGWLRDHDGVDIVEQTRTTARFRGQQCGVAYAEAFTPCLTWLRATTRRFLP